jgi:hypothetical protein
MLLVGLVGCAFEVFSFTVEESTEVTVPAGEGPTPVDVMSLDDLVDLDGLGQEALEEAGVEKGDLSHLRIVGLSFEVVEPADADFDFLQAVEVWLSADGLDDVQIASEDPLPVDATELPIEPSDVDLAPYVLGEGLVVSTFATGQPPLVDTVIRTTVAVEIGVTAKGAWSQITGR